MYRVLLVDDEEINYQMYEKLVDWQAKGFVIAGTAMDGLEALRQYEKLAPDLIVMDIQLPLMDGLECVRCIREEDQKTRIVIASAYDEFSYAQRAIRYGVQDYLLKPVSRLLLNQLLDRIKTELEEEEDASAAVSVFDTEPARQLSALLYGQNLEFSARDYTIWGFSITESSGFFVEGEELNAFLKDFFEKTVQNHSEYIMEERMFHVGQNARGWFCVAQPAPAEPLAEPFYVDLLRSSCTERRWRLQAYPHRSDCFPEWVTKLVKAESYGFYEKKDPVYDLDESPFSQEELHIPEKSRLIREAVTQNSCSMLCTAVAEYMKKASEGKIHPSFVKEELFDFLLQIKFFLNQMDQKTTFFVLRGIKPETIHHFQTQDSLKQWILGRIEDTFREIGDTFFGSGTSLVLRTNAFTALHYRYASFSVQDAADYNGISKNYFTGLYKEQAGIGFWEYVTNLRMEKAKEMLLTTDDLVSVIGSSVGYENEFHFSRKFKEYTGESPGQFRRTRKKSKNG